MKREFLLSKATSLKSSWDVIIIGGGATGLGVALEAAGRGYQTLLLEKKDFASATSSNSTKLIHGGIRYLKDFSIKRLRESAQEQQILTTIAPHLVDTVPFVIPSNSWFQHIFHRSGLLFFDALTLKIKSHCASSISSHVLKDKIPNFLATEIKGGILYQDCQFDDARLALALAQTAEKYGAVPLNYMPVTSILKKDGMVCGVTAKDQCTDIEYEFFGSVVINACGPFVDSIRKKDEKNSTPIILPMQGTHLVLPSKFIGGSTAFIIPKTSKGKVLYGIPWQNRTLIGTTEMLLEAPDEEAGPNKEEIEYLLEESSKYLVTKPGQNDILSVFSGIRPLVQPKSHQQSKTISRDHSIITSSSGLITITGGKWTTYRIMAEDVIKVAAKMRGLPYHSFTSSTVRIHGWKEDGDMDMRLQSYGSNADAIYEIEKTDPSLSHALHPELPITKSIINYAIHKEMAITLEDILVRRTRSLLLNARATIEIAPQVAEYVAFLTKKDTKWQENELKQFTSFAEKFIPGKI
jgi:glycerol-3-phosphate dehydrogenase